MPKKSFKYCIENCLNKSYFFSKTISRYQYKFLYNQYRYRVKCHFLPLKFYLKCDFILHSRSIEVTNGYYHIFLDLTYCKESFYA